MDGNQAVLSATDLELGVRYRVSGVQVEEPGQAILPTAQVMAILREAPDETLRVRETTSGVEVAGQFARFELPSEDPLQFPEIPEFEDVESRLSIQSGRFATMIRRTIFAAAPENARYALHSLRVEYAGERLTMVATDGKRLAVMSGSCAVAGERASGAALVPPKAMALFQKVLMDPEETIQLALRENDLLLKSGKVTIYSRLTEGRFPNYRDVVPKESKVSIPLVVGPFHAVVRQAKIVTSEESRGVDFRFRSGQLTLWSRSAEAGESEVQMPISYDGDPIEVTFDPTLLIEALRVLEPQDELTLLLIDSRSAAVLRTNDGYEYVVMPLTKERDR
jgi:DNA polymerase-3 subunit beta